MFNSANVMLPARLTAAIAGFLTAASCLTAAPADAVSIHRANTIIAPSPAPKPSAPAVAAPGYVYVADQQNNAVWVFDQPIPAPVRQTGKPIVMRPVNEITGLSDPQGLGVDATGNLYVANFAANNILVYPPGGGGPPIRTYSTGLNGPTDVKVDSGGDVYVTNFGIESPNAPYNYVVEYGANSFVPTATWQSPIPNAPILGIALQTPDASSNGVSLPSDVYVSYATFSSANTGGILWCPQGATTCFNTDIVTTQLNSSLAFQYNTFPLTLLVPSSSTSVVDVYKLKHGKLPASALSVPKPSSLAFNQRFSQLFVSSNPSNGAPTLNEYNYPSGTLSAVFAPAKAGFLTGVALFPSGSF